MRIMIDNYSWRIVFILLILPAVAACQARQPNPSLAVIGFDPMTISEMQSNGNSPFTNIAVADSDGAYYSVLYKAPVGSSIECISWSPTGSKICFILQTNSRYETRHDILYTLDVLTSPGRVYSHEPSILADGNNIGLKFQGCAWSTSAPYDKIARCAFTAVSYCGKLLLVSTTRGDSTKVIASEDSTLFQTCTWDPQGQRLAMSAQDARHNYDEEIRVIDPRDGHLLSTFYGDHKYTINQMDWSRKDGSEFVFDGLGNNQGYAHNTYNYFIAHFGNLPTTPKTPHTLRLGPLTIQNLRCLPVSFLKASLRYSILRTIRAVSLATNPVWLMRWKPPVQ
jgi:hypothetical protein